MAVLSFRIFRAVDELNYAQESDRVIGARLRRAQARGHLPSPLRPSRVPATPSTKDRLAFEVGGLLSEIRALRSRLHSLLHGGLPKPPHAEDRAAESRLRSLCRDVRADHDRLRQTVADVRGLTSPNGLADARSHYYESQFLLSKASEKCRILQSDVDGLESAVAELRARTAARSQAEKDLVDRLTAAAAEHEILKAFMREPYAIALPAELVDETSDICAIVKKVRAAECQRCRAREELERVMGMQQREIAAMRDPRRRDRLFVTTHVIGYQKKVFVEEEDEEEEIEAPIVVAEDGILLTQMTKESESGERWNERSESYLSAEEEGRVSVGTQATSGGDLGVEVPPLELGSLGSQGKNEEVVLKSGSSEGELSASQMVLLVDAWTLVSFVGAGK